MQRPPTPHSTAQKPASPAPAKAQSHKTSPRVLPADSPQVQEFLRRNPTGTVRVFNAAEVLR